jgi:hypothetical protein
LIPDEHELEDDSPMPRREGSEKLRNEKSRNGHKREIEHLHATNGQEPGDTLFTTLGDMTTNWPVPTFIGRPVEFQMPAGRVGEIFSRLIRKSSQTHMQYSLEDEVTAQQAIADYEREVKAQGHINEIQRMQEAAILERQKSNTRRRTQYHHQQQPLD